MGEKQEVIVSAPGKINLYLDILGTNHKNYHLLNTVMQSIDLQDTITIQRSAKDDIEVNLDKTWSHIPTNDNNIAYKAVKAFTTATGVPREGMVIYIDKTIPDQAGLGGGSSDAAAVLVGLNHLYKTNLTVDELCWIGVKVGADVPFCIRGGCAVATGIGEVMEGIPSVENAFFVIVKPSVGVSTSNAFDLYDNLENPTLPKPIETILRGLQSRDLGHVGKGMYNVFEQALTTLPTQGIKEALLACGALGASLSGSGSAVVGLFDERSLAQKCLAQLSKLYDKVILTTPVNHGARVI